MNLRTQRSVAICVAALAIYGCRHAAPSSPTATAPPCSPEYQREESDDAEAQLIACLVAPATTSQVRVFVAIRNRRSAPLRARPRFELEGTLESTLSDSLGRTLPYVATWHADEVSPEVIEYLMPIDGVVGRVIDLACPIPDFEPDHGSCYQVYDWTPGRYSLRFRYHRLWTCLDDPCTGSNVREYDLMSEPIEIHVRSP